MDYSQYENRGSWSSDVNLRLFSFIGTSQKQHCQCVESVRLYVQGLSRLYMIRNTAQEFLWFLSFLWIALVSKDLGFCSRGQAEKWMQTVGATILSCQTAPRFVMDKCSLGPILAFGFCCQWGFSLENEMLVLQKPEEKKKHRMNEIKIRNLFFQETSCSLRQDQMSFWEKTMLRSSGTSRILPWILLNY